MQTCNQTLRGCLRALPEASHVAALRQPVVLAPHQIPAALLQLQPPAPAHAAWAGQCVQPRSRAATAQRMYASGPAAGTAASALVDRSPTAAEASAAAEQPWEIKMLYDGDCPLCMREVNMLRRRDADVGKIQFVDIVSPDYDASANAGISFEQAMGEIHAILPDGQVIKNIDVFKRLYEAVGLGWVYRFAEIEPLRRAADAVYGVWARYRLPITGRPDIATVLEQRSNKTCRSSP